MEIDTVATTAAPGAIGPYSQAIIANGLVFCSGQVALDPATGEPVGGDVSVQTARVIDNLAAVLAAAGSDLAHVVKTTVYLTDFKAFATMNEVYAARFGAHRPARATVGVSSLPKGLQVEIDCVAVVVAPAR